MVFGIKTIIDYSNYGNRFQNYAVQKILSKHGIAVNVDKKYPSKTVMLKFWIWNIFSGFLDVVFPNRSFRYFKGIRFNKHLKYASPYKCDAFFYGSDQIWNPTYERPDFLIPQMNDKKTIALSASIGLDFIPEKYEAIFEKGLPMFDKISVREHTAVDIVQKYTGIEPEILIDPTLYLTADEWREIEAKKIKGIPSKYVLAFFLGHLSEERRGSINSFASDNNAEVINIFEGEWDNLSPEEMLKLIDNAFVVLTDSFHGTVFSIIFSRPFLTYSREDNLLKMNSRLNTLLKMFHMEDRYDAKLDEGILKCDYSNKTGILDYERNRMDRFIEEAISSLR